MSTLARALEHERRCMAFFRRKLDGGAAQPGECRLAGQPQPEGAPQPFGAAAGSRPDLSTAGGPSAEAVQRIDALASELEAALTRFGKI